MWSILSGRLSRYFGEDIQDACGHCSICCDGPSSIPSAMRLVSLSEYDYNEVTRGFFDWTKNFKASAVTIARFLCGVNSPVLAKSRTKKLQEFGILSKYPYKEVEAWVVRNKERHGQ